MQIEMELQGLERSRNRFYEEQARSQERVLKDQEKLPQAEKLYEKQQLDVQNARDTQDKPYISTTSLEFLQKRIKNQTWDLL